MMSGGAAVVPARPVDDCATRWRDGACARGAAANLTASLAALEYREMLRLLEKRGWKKAASQTPLEFAAAIPAPELAAPVAQFTELYQSARFGDHPAPVEQMSFAAARDPRCAPLAQACRHDEVASGDLVGAIALPSPLCAVSFPGNSAERGVSRLRGPASRCFGIPNCLDVVSNLFSLAVGAWGLQTVWGSAEFLNSRERWP